MPRAPHRRLKTPPEAALQNELPPPVEVCPLCGRALGGIVNKHHLLPLSEGGAGTTTVPMHKICHDKIHAVLTEKQLRDYYHTAERLRMVPEIQDFIRWVRKKPPEFYTRTKGKKQ